MSNNHPIGTSSNAFVSDTYSHRTLQRHASRLQHGLVVLCVLLLTAFASPLNAKAPKVTHLFPPGAQRGSTTMVTCHGEFDWPISVSASAGHVDVQEEQGRVSITIPEDIPTDRIWLRFYDKQGATAPIPFLLGNLPETTEVEPNDAPTSAQQLSKFAKPPNDARVTINGALQKKGDADCFRIQLRKGQTLVAAIAGNSHFGSPLDAILQVVAPNGIVLAENHDAVGLDPRIAFRCTQSGEHIVRVFAFPATPNQSIQFHGGAEYTYRLTLTTGPYILHTMPSSIQSQQLGFATPFSVSPVGWNIPRHTMLPVRVSRNDNGSVLTGKTHAAVGYVSSPGWAGTFRLPVLAQRALPAVTSARNAASTVCPPSSTADGLLQPKMTSVFQLPLTKGQKTSIIVEAVSLNSPMVPKVSVTGPNEKVIYKSPETGPDKDVSQIITPTETGVHRLEVRDRYGHGSAQHFYRVTVKPARDDFTVLLENSTLTISKTGVAELPVTIQREVHSKGVGEIIVEAVGLPAGVQCEPAVSQQKGDTSKKVTLKLQSKDAKLHSGPIRIRAYAVDSPLRRYGLSPEQHGLRFDSIWLTVTGKTDD